MRLEAARRRVAADVASVGRRPQVSIVCSAVAHFGVTLQRGRFISTGGELALDVFELSDEEGVLGTRGERADGAAPADDGRSSGRSPQA